MTSAAGVVIVGAGHAGATCAVALRDAGYAGSIVLIGDDPDGSYERPPLSKGFLKGATSEAELNLRGAGHFADVHKVEFVVGGSATQIDRESRVVLLADGRQINYRQLVLATGATPRLPVIPGVASDGVFILRTHEDAVELRKHLHPGARAVVIGGGFIGLEVAAAARQLGLGVDVVEICARLLKRSTSEEVAEHLERLHRAQGVDLHLGRSVDRIVADPSGRVASVLLVGGQALQADVVVLGTGVMPAQALAEDAGLLVDDGVLTDHQLRTSDPDIYAIGDLARFPAGSDGRTVRVESVQNALEQARCVARQMATGSEESYTSVPWFWSEQYNVKLQLVGASDRVDETHLSQRAGGGFSVYGFSDSVLEVVESVDATSDHIRARRILAGRITTKAELSDADFDLQTVLTDVRRHSSPAS